jgi:predicted molibdopterin-dependent oxidoreductase YjgC
MLNITINGKKVSGREGQTVLQIARDNHIYIPTLCDSPDLDPYGSCRMCVVEIENMRGLPTSCTTPATEGMVVRTETPSVQVVRRTALELIIADHNGDCLTCGKNRVCELQAAAAYIGINELHFPRTLVKTPPDTSNPFFNLDRDKCILCARCTRACNEITCVGAIDMAYRGHKMRVATFGDKPIFESICQGCGECVAHCPTGALTPKECISPTEEIVSTCPYCGTGCSLVLGVRNNRIVYVRGNTEGRSNRGQLCVKGRYGISEVVHSKERLTTPLVKKDGKFEKAGWDEVLETIARRIGQYQPDEVAVVSSSRATNEANYVAQKFARVALGTNNVDNCARV